MCKAYDMKKIECVCPILFASRKLYMTSASAQFSACNTISDPIPILTTKIQEVINEHRQQNSNYIEQVNKAEKACDNERNLHIPTTLLGNEGHPCSGLHAKMYARIAHKSPPVLSSLLQEGKPPEPI